MYELERNRLRVISLVAVNMSQAWLGKADNGLTNWGSWWEIVGRPWWSTQRGCWVWRGCRSIVVTLQYSRCISGGTICWLYYYLMLFCHLLCRWWICPN